MSDHTKDPLRHYMDMTTDMILRSGANDAPREARVALATALLEAAGTVLLSIGPPSVAAQVMYLHADAIATKAVTP